MRFSDGGPKAIAGTPGPAALKQGMKEENQTTQPQEQRSAMSKTPGAPELCEERGVTNASVPFLAELCPHVPSTGRCWEPNEFSENGSWPGDHSPCNLQFQRPC